jgi:hypothetical protein
VADVVAYLFRYVPVLEMLLVHLAVI